MFSGDLLHFSSELFDLRPILLIGGRYMEGQQMSQRVDRRMHLRSLAPLGTV